MEQCRRRLLALQPAQGQSDARRVEDVAVAAAVPADGAAPAPQRPVVPAQLPARQLARLSLLGHRTRSMSAIAAFAPAPSNAPRPPALRSLSARIGREAC